MSAQRRPLEDPAGVRDDVLVVARAGPCSFGELVAATRLPAVARAHVLHLVWHRRLAVDLAGPLGDGCTVWPVEPGGGG